MGNSTSRVAPPGTSYALNHSAIAFHANPAQRPITAHPARGAPGPGYGVAGKPSAEEGNRWHSGTRAHSPRGEGRGHPIAPRPRPANHGPLCDSEATWQEGNPRLPVKVIPPGKGAAVSTLAPRHTSESRQEEWLCWESLVSTSVSTKTQEPPACDSWGPYCLRERGTGCRLWGDLGTEGGSAPLGTHAPVPLCSP